MRSGSGRCGTNWRGSPARRPRAATAPPAVIEPWEHRFGDGTGAVLIPGGQAYFLTDLLARDDGTVVTVGTYWHDSGKRMWAAAFAADGMELWERTYAGMPCGAALIEDGFAVVGHDIVEGQESGVLMARHDGLGPTGLGLTFEPHGIAADGGGGFVVFGAADGWPIAQRYRANGAEALTWTPPADLFPQAAGGAVTAATPVPGSRDIRLLGYVQPAGAGPRDAAVWTAVLGDDGTARGLAMLGDIALASAPACDFVLHLWAIAAAADGFIVRYDFEQATVGHRTAVLRLDAQGREQWRREHPIDARAQPDPAAAMEAGVYEISAVSATADGGALVAGLLRRPVGRGAGFVARWDAEGTELWSTELRRTPEDEPVRDAYFAAVEEAADGGVLAAMTDGVVILAPRAFVFRLGADGSPP